MKVLKFGKLESSGNGSLRISGFEFGITSSHDDINREYMMMMAIIDFLLNVEPSDRFVCAENTNHSSDIIVMKAIDKAREESK